MQPINWVKACLDSIALRKSSGAKENSLDEPARLAQRLGEFESRIRQLAEVYWPVEELE